MITGYLNLFFLADVNAFILSIDLLYRSREDLDVILRTVGEIDALCSVAAFRSSAPFWCPPDVRSDPGPIHGKALYHPGIADAIPNDLHVDGPSILITGSNMSGKTTYLRTAGVCAILAQTIATCPARAWAAPFLDVHTLIQHQDDQHSGKSYFLVEAEFVKEMLTAAERSTPQLFIIDELYRGTNTEERLAAACAVLTRLNRGNHRCIVATHDLALLDMLPAEWEFLHFREGLVGSDIRFDFQIRPGAAVAGNALRLLTATGYPADVMSDAYRTFERLERDLTRARRAGDAAARQRHGYEELP